jgi:hypothetical protein
MNDFGNAEAGAEVTGAGTPAASSTFLAHIGHSVSALPLRDDEEGITPLWCIDCLVELYVPLRPRQLASERSLTRSAALQARVLPMALQEFAERRAGSRPVEALELRRFDIEALEEAADGRNYGVWWFEQITLLALAFGEDGLPPELVHEVGFMLEGFAKAFHHAQQAQTLQADWLKRVEQRQS